jgi:hypothetical protein
MKKTLVALVLVLSCGALCADDAFDAWKKQDQAAFSAFKQKENAEFAKYLEKQWKEFKAFKETPLYPKPKIETPPVSESRRTFSFPSGTRLKDVKTVPPKAKSPQPLSKPQLQEPSKNEEPKPAAKETTRKSPAVQTIPKGTEVPFFTVSFYSPLQKGSLPGLKTPLSPQAIAGFWTSLSALEYQSFVEEARAFQSSHAINDWGYITLLVETGKLLSGGDKLRASLFTWFMLVQSGFDVKVGYGKNTVFLLVPSANMLYGVPYFSVDGKRYFITGAGEPSDSLYIYEGQYPDAKALVDMQVDNLPVLGGKVGERVLTFSYGGKEYSIPVRYSEDIIAYCSDYPQTDFPVYFRNPLSPEAFTSLAEGLKPILVGKTEAEACNVILRFVQTAFEYLTDDEQFGREKPFFPEETLHYPAADCEDRSVFFALLVRELLGLDVVGLKYPGHLAAAVRFPSKVPGDSLSFGGKTYLICDPTYINADIGMCMPDFKGVSPEVITY